MSTIRTLAAMAAHYRNAISEAIAIWESIDSFDDPELVMAQVMETLKGGLGTKFKKGDSIIIRSTGEKGVLTDIQPEHNRYQLKGKSGWIYGINDLSLPEAFYMEFGIEQQPVRKYTLGRLMQDDLETWLSSCSSTDRKWTDEPEEALFFDHIDLLPALHEDEYVVCMVFDAEGRWVNTVEHL